MKKIFLFALMIIAHWVSGQDKYFFVAWDITQPLSNTTWIEDISARGIKIGYRTFITPKFSAGVDLSSNAFDQYMPTQTFESGNGAITTDFFRYIYSYSATLNGQYYFADEEEEKFFPYVGLGLGANNNEYVVYYNIYTNADKSWGFLARPEAGLLYKFGSRRSLGLMAAIHYDYSTNQSDGFGYNNFTALGFQLGVILLER